MALDQLIALSSLEILAHHLGDQFLKQDLRRPAKFFLGLARVAEQGFDFSRAEVTRVDLHDGLAVPGAGLVDALTCPLDLHAQFIRSDVHKVTHAVLYAGGDDEVFGLLLLQHQPLHLYIVLSMTPVALGIEVAQVQAVLQAKLDARQGAGDLAGHERLAADRGFVIEQDAVAGVHAVGLAVVDCDPVGIQFGHGVGATRIEGRGLFLWLFLHQTEELGGAGLVETGFLFQAEDADRFEDAQCTKGIGVGSVLRLFEGHRDMALCGKVVDLIRLQLLDNPDQTRAVGQIAVVQKETHILFVPVFVEMVDTIGVEEAGATFDAVNDVALVE